MKVGYRMWVVAAVLAVGASAGAGQAPYQLYDVPIESAKDVQRLCDSPLRVLEEDVHLGWNRVAIRKGEEWQLLALGLPTRFAGIYEPQIPQDPESRDADYRTEWLTYAQLIEEWDGMLAANPGLMRKYTIGVTRENRPIYAYRMFRPNLRDSYRPKKSILILGDTHAREWMSPSVVLHLGKMLLQALATEDSILMDELEDKVGVYFVPVFNVDGYLYSWSNDRLWRKNRRNNGSSYGVDLNRNYEKAWGGAGSSGTPSSSTYRGPSPASEPEIQAVRAFSLSLPDLRAVIDYHSYAGKILYPWSYTTDPIPPADVTRHQAVGTAMRDAILAYSNTSYQVGQGSVALYVASGTSKDWFYDRFGATAYTVEVEGTTFDPPETTITPVQDNNWIGFRAFLESVLP